MVNVIIYLRQQSIAENLAKEIVGAGLAAGASIEVNNNYFVKEDTQVIKTLHTVLTLQSKALLFTEIVTFVENFVGEEVPMYTFNITQTNARFHEFIRERTIKI